MEYLPVDMAAPTDLTAANRNTLIGAQRNDRFVNLQDLPISDAVAWHFEQWRWTGQLQQTQLHQQQAQHKQALLQLQYGCLAPTIVSDQRLRIPQPQNQQQQEQQRLRLQNQLAQIQCAKEASLGRASLQTLTQASQHREQQVQTRQARNLQAQTQSSFFADAIAQLHNFPNAIGSINKPVLLDNMPGQVQQHSIPPIPAASHPRLPPVVNQLPPSSSSAASDPLETSITPTAVTFLKSLIIKHALFAIPRLDPQENREMENVYCEFWSSMGMFPPKSENKKPMEFIFQQHVDAIRSDMTQKGGLRNRDFLTQLGSAPATKPLPPPPSVENEKPTYTQPTMPLATLTSSAMCLWSNMDTNEQAQLIENQFRIAKDPERLIFESNRWWKSRGEFPVKHKSRRPRKFPMNSLVIPPSSFKSCPFKSPLLRSPSLSSPELECPTKHSPVMKSPVIDADPSYFWPGQPRESHLNTIPQPTLSVADGRIWEASAQDRIFPTKQPTGNKAEFVGKRNTMTPPTALAPEIPPKKPESARSSMAPADMPVAINLVDDTEMVRSSIPPSDAATLDLVTGRNSAIVEDEPSGELIKKPKLSFREELAERKRKIVLEREGQRQEESTIEPTQQTIDGNSRRQAIAEATSISDQASRVVEHFRGVNQENPAEREGDKDLGSDDDERKAKRPKLRGELSSARQPPITGLFRQTRERVVRVKGRFELSQASRTL